MGQGVCLTLSMSAFAGLTDSFKGGAIDWAGIPFLLVSLGLFLRGFLVGFVVFEDALLLRGWLWTRRVRRSQITAVQVARYSGCWTRWSETRLLTMLVVRTEHGKISAPEVAATSRKARRLALSLATALGVPYWSDAVPVVPEGPGPE